MLKILFSNFQKTFTNFLIRLMYFSLLTNYMNYVAFDEALALLLQLKKNKSNFFFYIYIQFTLFKTKSLQPPGTYIFKRT